jgi:hypothetical protein
LATEWTLEYRAVTTAVDAQSLRLQVICNAASTIRLDDLFVRTPPHILCVDGFESGDTTAWSLAVP